MRVLVLGASGMIGSTFFRVLNKYPKLNVTGTVRHSGAKALFAPSLAAQLVEGVDVESTEQLARAITSLRPDVVINCAGLTKHRHGAEDALISIPINALMPHRLAELCKLGNVRLIHISTDCVFSGKQGNYTEVDFADAVDIYGKSKALGEVTYPHTLTLRTSTIGHELETKYGLLEWFLAQETQCKGFSKAIFSGLPTLTLAHIIGDIVLAHPELTGLYHIAAQPIDKYRLLQLIARIYQKPISIIKDDSFTIDRSLNAARFKQATGYEAPSWETLVQTMHDDNT